MGRARSRREPRRERRPSSPGRGRSCGAASCTSSARGTASPMPWARPRRSSATGARRVRPSNATRPSPAPTSGGPPVTWLAPAAGTWSGSSRRGPDERHRAPPDLREAVLANGLRVVVAHRPGVPLVAARLVVRAGSALDPAGAFGLAHLLALSARARGAGRRTGRAIDDLVESLGANLAGGAEEDASVHGLSAPVEVLPRLLEVLAVGGRAPHLPPGRVRAAPAAGAGRAGPRLRRGLHGGRPGVPRGGLRRPPLRPPGRWATAGTWRASGGGTRVAFHARWFGPAGSPPRGLGAGRPRPHPRRRRAPARVLEARPGGAAGAAPRRPGARGGSSWSTSPTPPRRRSGSAASPSRAGARTTSRRWSATRCWAGASPPVSSSRSG